MNGMNASQNFNILTLLASPVHAGVLVVPRTEGWLGGRWWGPLLYFLIQMQTGCARAPFFHL